MEVEKWLLCIESLGLEDDFKDEQISLVRKAAPGVVQFFLEVDHVPMRSVGRLRVPALSWPFDGVQVESPETAVERAFVKIEPASLVSYVLWQSTGRRLEEDVCQKDLDRNGRLSAREWMKGDFSKVDTDGDGEITLAEYYTSLPVKK